jgi:pimeloyl-ACP methyl ester carboxylesterase
LYGAKAVREMRAAPTRAVIGPREPVVVLPGIMGSLLASIRGVTALLWINPAIFLEGKGNYLDLNADASGDADPAVEVAPVSIEKIFYLKLNLILRQQAQLYEFPYDWRRAIEYNADVLHTCLERWAAGDPNRKFTLVGHSMGGIVSRAYLTRHPREAERRIKRVISLGTPYFGAAGAIENMVNGNEMMALAQSLNGGNVPQQMLLSFPSIYQLLPAPPDLFPSGRPYPADWDLYRASEWRWPAIRQDYLDLARRSHAALHRNLPDVETVQIAGCNFPTTTDVRRTFDAAERPGYECVKQEAGPDAGDATVPLWAAVLPGATMYYVNEKHRYLPSNDKVIAGVLELLHDGAPRLARSIPPKKTGLFREVSSPRAVESEADELREKLEQGTADGNDLARLYFAL